MKRQFVIACMITLLLSGCSQPQSQATEPIVEEPAVVAETEETSAKVVDETPQGTEATGKYTFDRFAVTLEGQWLELNKSQDEIMGSWNLTAENGIILHLSVMADENKVVDETTIQEEADLDSYLNLIENTEVKLDNGVHFYGAFIEDHATETEYCYYLTKIDNQVVALIFNKKEDFVEEDIQWMHSQLETFEIIE